MQSAVMFSKASDEWSTPQDFFDELDAEFGFGLDAAASEDNSKCTAFFALADDALVQDWTPWRDYAVWLNPPYSRCRDFIAKAAKETARGCTVVCLVPARVDTQWWHLWVWNAITHRPHDGVEVRFIKGRLKFGNSQNSAPFPSVVVIFRPPSVGEERSR